MSVVPPEKLLQHAAFLERLATRLVKDPGLRDDAMQETWLAALNHRGEAIRGRGWLATVFRNAVSTSRRGETRRAKREFAVAKPERTASTIDVVARDELSREIVAYVLALPSDMREVVIRRFYDGYPPRVIADQLDISVNTVKSRLRRALTLLRKQLGPLSPSWRASILGLAGVRDTSFQLSLGAATTTKPALGAALMSSSTKIGSIVLIAVLLSLGGWWALSELSTSTHDAEQQEHDLLAAHNSAGPALNVIGGRADLVGATESRGPEKRVSESSTDSRGANSRRASETTTPLGPTYKELRSLGLLEQAPPGVIQGALFDGRTLSSDADAVVWKADNISGAKSIPVAREPLRIARVGSDGQFRFDDLEPGTYFVGVRVSGEPPRLLYRPIQVDEKETDKAIALLGNSTVRGTVYDTQGNPAAAVAVRLSLSSVGPTSRWKSIVQTRTDHRGTYAFSRLPNGGGWLSVATTNDFDDRPNTSSRRFSVKADQELVENFGSIRGKRVVSGRVMTECGEPMRGPGHLVINGLAGGSYVDVRYQADGTFTQHLEPGEYVAKVWHADAFRSPRVVGSIKIHVGNEDVEKDLLVRGVRISGHITNAIAKSRIYVYWRRVGAKTWCRSNIDHELTYVIDALAPGSYELVVSPLREGHEARIRSIQVLEGDTLISQDLTAPSK